MATGLFPTTDLNPLQRAFNLFLLGLPSSDLDHLVNFIRHSDEAERLSNQIEFMRQTTDVVTAIATQDQIPSSPASSTGSTRTSRGKKTGEKKLRPLNSFIAYRSKDEHLFCINKFETTC